MSVSEHTRAWVLNNQPGIESLILNDGLTVPDVKEDEVLVKIYAVSLNYRDLAVVKGNLALPSGDALKKNFIPGSDGAGVVQAVGSNVEAFAVGDRVCTHLTHGLAYDQFPQWPEICAGLGHTLDGTLREFGVFHETSLVKMPSNLSFTQASTLTCSGLTAWNALFGIEGKTLRKGGEVLVQGTGGVSIAALQFAVAAGANVVATTSSDEKAKRLKDLGAREVINYREVSNWGKKAKGLTAEGQGVDLVVDVGGPSTLKQSLNAVRPNGVIAASGLLGESPDGTIPTIIDCIFTTCIARGIVLGTREQFDAMNRFIVMHDIKPNLDDRIFNFPETREAFTFMSEQKHFSKVVIKVCDE